MEAAMILISVFLLLAVTVAIRSHRKTTSRLPPGPKPLPIVGNILDIPRDPQWMGYASLAKKYGVSCNSRWFGLHLMVKIGDMIGLNMFGQPVIILGSSKAAIDLLDKRSACYSDRPELPMASLCAVSLINRHQY